VRTNRSLHPSLFHAAQWPLPICSLPAKHVLIDKLVREELLLVDAFDQGGYVAQRRTALTYDVDVSDEHVRAGVRAEMRRDWTSGEVAYVQ